jgi:hypothetical protein
MDQVTTLVKLLKEKTPEGKVLTADVVMQILKKKLDPSVINNLGGEPGLLARVKVLLAPPAPAQQQQSSSAAQNNNKNQQQKKKKQESSSSEDDDSDDDDSDDDSDSEDDEEDFESDEEGDEEEEDDDDFEFDDDSSDDEKESEAKAGDRRGRDEKETANPEANVANPNTEHQVADMLAFLKKCSIAVPRKKNDDESFEQYRDSVLKPVFASKELDPSDTSKNALRKWKVRAELLALQADGADVSLDRNQRRGKPIFDDSGKVVGITGGNAGASAASTATVNSMLLDDE